MEAGGGFPVVSYLLQQTLRRLCTESDWVYGVFWRILPRNYPPPKWDTESSVLDRSKGNKRNWILVWEDGFCDFHACARAASESNPSTCYTSSPDQGSEEGSQFMQPELFFKMSHEVYSYGEGLMGKVAADNSHKWVYKEPTEADPQYPPSWQGALDPHPRTWDAQFKSGIETIAIVAVKEGLIQLGSVKKIMEDLNFVLFLQRKFNYLQSIPGVYAMHPLQALSNAVVVGGGGGRKPSSSCSGESSSEQQQQQQQQQHHQYSHCWEARESVMNQQQQLVRPAGAAGDASISQECSLFTCPPPHLPPDPKSAPSPSPSPSSLPPDCPSPPKKPKTGYCNIINTSPAMSSLHALLSRLPSVTSPPPTISPSPNSHHQPHCSPSHRHHQCCSCLHHPQPNSNSSSWPSPSTTPTLLSAPLKDPPPDLAFHRSSIRPAGAASLNPSSFPHHPSSTTASAAQQEIATTPDGACQSAHHRPEIENLSLFQPCYQSRDSASLGMTGFLDSFPSGADLYRTAAEDLETGETYSAFLREIIS